MRFSIWCFLIFFPGGYRGEMPIHPRCSTDNRVKERLCPKVGETDEFILVTSGAWVTQRQLCHGEVPPQHGRGLPEVALQQLFTVFITPGKGRGALGLVRLL